MFLDSRALFIVQTEKLGSCCHHLSLSLFFFSAFTKCKFILWSMAQGTEKMLMLIGEFKLVSFQICCQLLQSGVSVEGIHSGHRSLPGGHYCKSQRGLEMISVFHLPLAAAQRYSKWQKKCSRMALRVFSPPLPPPSLSNL